VSRLLILTGVDVEARGLARHLALGQVTASAWPHYRAGALEVVCVGLQAAGLEERLAAARPSLVISAGSCGALGPHLRRGDLVVPETVIGLDGSRAATAAWPGLVRHGSVLSVAGLVDTPAAKGRLWIETGALAADMESGPIVAWARTRGVPAAVVRGESDTAGQVVPRDLAGLVDPGGRVRRGQAIGVALSRPRALADALVLGRGTAAALAAVARVLGELARRSHG
jgi:adenosylhomocysteine nucleosidase